MADARRSARESRARAVRRRRIGLLAALVAAVAGGAVAVHAATGRGSAGRASDATGSSTAGTQPAHTKAKAKAKARAHGAGASTGGGATTTRALDLAHPLGPIPAASPGTAEIVNAGPAGSKGVALTFDDGYCDGCVGGLVRGAETTGAHVTFCPNGAYSSVWERYARRIRRLIALGQATICNHTWDHPDLRTLSTDAIEREITRNEDWIERTFGVTARPWFRPPYGAYDADVLAVAGRLGYTRILLWSGTTADSTARSRDYVASAVRYWAKPGAIILAHGNHPGTAAAFGAIVRIVGEKGLQTMTIAELLAGGRGKAGTTPSGY